MHRLAQGCGLLLPVFRVVCMSVCVDIIMSCAKTAELIKMPFGMWTRVGSRNHVLSGGSKIPQGKGQFLKGYCRAMRHFLKKLPFVCRPVVKVLKV